MPILKTKILGSQIEIQYDLSEHDKLLNLIESQKKRIDEFPIEGKISNISIIFLSALKVEDELSELKNTLEDKNKQNIEYQNNILRKEEKILNLSEKINIHKDLIKEKENLFKKLKLEFTSLNDQLNHSNLRISSEINNNIKIDKEIDDLNNSINLIKEKIKIFLT